MSALRILVVAMADSVHSARWLAQVADQGWSIDLFPSTPSGGSHPSLRGVTVHGRLYPLPRRDLDQRGVPVLSRRLAHLGERALDRARPLGRARALAALVRDRAPDVVHSLELQHSGYLTLEARRLVGDGFPPWLVTNWGSDIAHFGREPAHARRIADVLAACQAYSCECRRDVELARRLGFSGLAFEPSPNAGGLDLAAAAPLREVPTSRRRLVMVKGYQGWSGRALVALRALERCGDALRGRELCVYSASPEVAREARAVARRLRVPVEVLPADRPVPHREMLRRHGRARVAVGLGMSDGVSTSFLEALAMGAFPVQSWTACAGEWIADGRTGLLVPPEDEEEVARALRRALADDALVDAAAAENARVAAERLDARALSRRAIEMYRVLAARAPAAPGGRAG